eukprot:TRINITY_DN13963_c0_g1_i1.p2 TRINITY_DN13963_c0_g1~~TRINITY_DN13963_c0_g1_i1.p2  ORF type:complete len:114 (+),score=44.62 TRINITY_DN13963_c0_g1_i1:356-697(+)
MFDARLENWEITEEEIAQDLGTAEGATADPVILEEAEESISPRMDLCCSGEDGEQGASSEVQTRLLEKLHSYRAKEDEVFGQFWCIHSQNLMQLNLKMVEEEEEHKREGADGM